MLLRTIFFLALLFLSFTFTITVSGSLNKGILQESDAAADTIENFDVGQVNLLSWADQDLNPSSWQLSSSITYHSSPYSLKLFGNTWKLLPVQSRQLDSGSVWQVAAYIQTTAEIQGFGITDSINTLYYSFAGNEQVDLEEWITVYQGAFPSNTWNVYQLPVGNDWLDRFGYLPEIKGLIFINDRDFTSSGTVYFDEVLDITETLPIPPLVSIEYTIGKMYRNQADELVVDVQFTSVVYDPDSWIHSFLWNFGDDSVSTAANPSHTFLVLDDHDYTVFLTVTDPTGRIGTASCRIAVDPGPTTFPITMSFTGDIMFARRIQTYINQHGYQALFNSVLPYLRDSSDITIGNLECTLTTSNNAHPTKPIILKGSPQSAAALPYGGVDLVTLANNHAIDYGAEGLVEMREALRDNEVIYFGAGLNSYEAMQPAFISRSGRNIALLGCSDRTGQYNNYQPYLDAGFNKPGFANLTQFNIIKQINSVRDVADIVIMEMHSGSEYSLYPENSDPEAEYYVPTFAPSDGDREIRRFAIDHGADAVICHHPHIIHGFEVYKHKLIAHSLGNFIFDLDYTETYPSMILNCKVNESGIYDYTVIPVYIDDYVPQVARGEFGLYLLDDLAAKSKLLDTYLWVDRENVTAEIILDTASIQPVVNTSSEALDLYMNNGFAESEPVRLQKLGSISSIESLRPEGNWQFRVGKEFLWFGNFEDEGCTLWELNNSDEWYDTSHYYRGSRSLCQKRTAGLLPLNTELEENMMLYSDTSAYTLHSRIRTENLTVAGVAVQFFESRSSSTPLGSSEITADTGSNSSWKFYYSDCNLPSNTTFINMRLRTEAPQSGIAYSWFDDAGLIQWTEWQNYTPFIAIPYPNDYYWIQIRNSNQNMAADLKYNEVSFKEFTPVSSGTDVSLPLKFSLSQNYPNPFNPSTRIDFEVPLYLIVRLKIYNILGEEVKTLVNTLCSPGKNSVIWKGDDNYGRSVSSGIYFYRLESGGTAMTKKLMLLR